jgi:hypothetical protein
MRRLENFQLSELSERKQFRAKDAECAKEKISSLSGMKIFFANSARETLSRKGRKACKDKVISKD